LPFKGEKTYYATADVNGTNIVSSGEKITFDNKPSRAAIQPVLFSVWFARMSNSYKILNCFGENSWMEKSAILSSGFAGFSSKVEFYGFVCQTIASKYFNAEKDRYATGATQVSLTNEGLAKINVLIPSEHVIIQYSKFVEPLMYKAELLKNENFKLKESRDRLLPKLMNGEL
jgi:type I restriction enzyme S subunit